MTDTGAVTIGQTAYDFTLPATSGEQVTLSSLRGKPVLLVFYPHAFTGLCTDELCELRDNLEMFETAGVQLFGVSVDPLPALKVFHEQQGYQFPLLADFWPHGEVSRAYGVFDPGSGTAVRGSFLCDADGRAHWDDVPARSQVRALGDRREARARRA